MPETLTIIQLPEATRESVNSLFDSETGATFKYHNQFVYFGDIGASSDTPNDFLYWYGSFNPPADTSDLLALGAASTEAALAYGQQKGALPSSAAPSLSVKYRQSPTGAWWYMGIASISQLIADGTTRLTFVAGTAPAAAAAAAPAESAAADPYAGNVSNICNGGNSRCSTIRLGDINLYTNVLSKLFENLDERIKFYEITFDTTFNALYYAEHVRGLGSQIRQMIASAGDVEINNLNSVQFKFSLDFKVLEGLTYFGSGPGDNQRGINIPIDSGMFSQTINSLIYRLPVFYAKYHTIFSFQGGAGRVFLSADEIKQFLNKYVMPQPNIAASNTVRSLVEKFLVGDARVLDDEFFNSYQIARHDIGPAFKTNLNREISQQYEAIGDFLGDKWIKGDFQDIHSVDDFYDQVLDHVGIPNLIKMSATCLLKLIPIEELLDTICAWVLEETQFEAHIEYIIEELDSMEEGVAKNLARELSQIYFDRIEEVEQYTSEIVLGTISGGGTKLVELLQEAVDLGSWSSMEDVETMFTKTITNAVDQITLLGISQYGAFSDNPGETSIEAKRSSAKTRKEAAEEELLNLNQRLEVFNEVGIPQGQLDARTYYTNEMNTMSNEETKLKNAAENIIDQVRLYNVLSPLNFDMPPIYVNPVTSGWLTGLKNAIIQDRSTFDFTHMGILHDLMALNPYISNDDKIIFFRSLSFTVNYDPAADEIKAQGRLENLDFSQFSFNSLAASEAAAAGVDISTIKFAFGAGYSNLANNSAEKKDSFALNLLNVQSIFEYIAYLENHETAPLSILNELGKLGGNSVDTFLETLLVDPLKKHTLCLAIMAVVPAAGYLIYELIKDPSAVGAFFVDNASAIWDGFSKKIQMFSRTDWPVNDILGSLVDTLIQVGYNIMRDLLVNGIMMLLNKMLAACADEESVNAPYSPIGAVDLSSFMIHSKKGSDGQATSRVENSNSFNVVMTVAPGITISEFKKVLGTLSSSFTIKEMCSFLSKKAQKSLYIRAIASLDSLEFLKGTEFYNRFVNDIGIKELLDLISGDIEPALCAQAVNNFEKEKSILLEICFGKNDKALEQLLCKDMSPEECLKLLSAKSEMPISLIPGLLDGLNNIFNTTTQPDPCADGKGIFDDSQKYSSAKIGNSIFGALEKTFESDISRIKSIYSDANAIFEADMFFSPDPSKNKLKKAINQSSKPTAEQNADEVAAIKKEFDNLPTSQGKVALKILTQVQGEIDSLEFARPETSAWYPAGSITFSKSVIGDSPSSYRDRNISFEFIPGLAPANTKLEITALKEGEANDVIATYSANKFVDLELQTPDSVLTTLMYHTAGNAGLSNISPKIINLVLDNDYYLKILNSILKDLFATTFKTGLYKKDEFIKLNLNKNTTYNSIADVGQCFLGFMNKTALNKQMQRLVDKLTCYAPESATKGPVNIATIKIALDCLVRAITVKELMKSLFVFGIFPSELPFDNEKSFYDQFINDEIGRSLKRKFENSGEKLSSFYNDVLSSDTGGFITDIMRILYQKNDMTDKEAYNLLKSLQIDFVKQQMIHTVSDSLASTVNDISEYQMVEQALNPVSGSGAYLEHLSTISYTDKIQALQNDYFTLYMNSAFQYSGVAGKNIPTKVRFPDPESPGNMSYPTFRRSVNKEVEFYDYTTLKLEKSAQISTILQGIDDGLVLERMVEIEYNADFISDPDLKEVLLKFLYALGSPNIMTTTPLHILKNFLYETKLIMLFPQLRKIINSFDDPGGIWTKYLDEWGGFSLFSDMFLFNFDPNHPYAMTMDRIISTDGIPGASDLQKDLDLAFTGKFYMNDFETLINEFSYPYWNLGERGKDISAWKKPWPNKTAANATTFYSAQSIKTGPVQTSFKELYNWMVQSATGPTAVDFNNIIDKTWGTYQGANVNFFEWLFTSDLNNILTINTVMRLTSCIKQNTGEIEGFGDIALPAQFDLPNNFAPDHPTAKQIMEQKYGSVSFGRFGNSIEEKDWEEEASYVCLPVLEVKNPIPTNIKWADFFLKIDKDSYIKESFYKQFEEPPAINWTTNGHLFIGDNAATDVFSYFHRFKTMTGVNIDTQQKTFVTKYISTEWFNIQGALITKEEILDHVANPAGFGPLKGLPYSWGMNQTREFTDATYEGNEFVYLTERSYASLSENHVYFASLSEEELQDYIMNLGGTQTLDYGGPNDYLRVGTWDIINYETGETIAKDAPKFIEIRKLWHQPDAEIWWDQVRYIDYGFVIAPTNPAPWQNMANSLNDTHPGAEFSGKFGYYKDPTTPVGDGIGNDPHMRPWNVGPGGGHVEGGDPDMPAGARLGAPWAGIPWGASPKTFGPWLDNDLWHLKQNVFGDTVGTSWTSGWAPGGLLKTEKEETPINMGKNKFNAYNFFAKMLINANDSGISKDLFELLLKTFFIKEQSTIIALLHKLYAEMYYPQIETSFDATINSAIEILLAAVATANGDYMYTSDANTAGDANIDYGAIVGQILMAFFGAMANSVDPTWKTDWFVPGPLTPFGMIAKALDENQDAFKKGSPKKGMSYTPPFPANCEDALEEQVDFFDIKNSKETE